MTRVLFHVQHLLGSGHLRRIALIARALARGGAVVTVLSGGRPLLDLDLGAASLVQLPPLHAEPGDLGTLRAADGRVLDAAGKAARCAGVLAAFKATRPDVLVIETYPFGRRALGFELEPLIAAARAMRPRPQILASIRDILVTRTPARNAETVASLRRDFDRVLVHGDPAFLPLEASFPAASITDLIHYTGFVVPDPVAPDGVPEVLVSVGGGAVGFPLLTAAKAAYRLGRLRNVPWRLIAGSALPPDQFEILARDLDPGIILERHRPDFRARLARARVSVSQAGYNTMVEILTVPVPSVLVPFAAAGETEQTQRAARLADLGLACVVPEADLTPETLAKAIDRAVPPATHGFALDGAERSALVIEALARGFDPP